jgi:hypothetical protein
MPEKSIKIKKMRRKKRPAARAATLTTKTFQVPNFLSNSPFQAS